MDIQTTCETILPYDPVGIYRIILLDIYFIVKTLYLDLPNKVTLQQVFSVWV